MEEWKTYRIGDICESVSETYRRGSASVVLVNTSDVLNGVCLNHTRVENKDLKGQFKKTFKRDDILYSEIRPTNKRFAYIDFDPTDYIASTKLMVIRSSDKVRPRYLFHFLKRQEMLDELQVLAESRSGTFPQITFSELALFEIRLPSLEAQDRIVATIDSFENKIALNNRINHNLEEQADCLISSAIETQSIGSAHLWDICSYVTERVNNDTLNNKNYISTDNMFANKGGIGIASTIPDGKCTSFKVRDVLVSNIRPYFKKIWRASFSGGCSNDVLCFRTTKGTSSFLYHLLRSDVFFDYVMSGAKGSKMPRGDKQHIMNWTIPVFEKAIITSLEDSLEVIDDRVAIIQEENRRLSAIRDSLLPMLMTNSIYINDLTC